jgi:hypothetical protein
MHAESAALPRRSPTVRSKLTNDPLRLTNVDGRTRLGRRFRDLVHAYAAEAGGRLTPALSLLIRQAALAALQLEQMQQSSVAGGVVDELSIRQQSNLLGRLRRELGRHRVKANSAPDLPSRLDKIETAIQARKSVNETWLVYLLSDWAEGCPVAFEKWEEDDIPRLKANALDRLVAAGKISEMDRERVTFIVRTIVHPPKWPDGPTQGE